MAATPRWLRWLPASEWLSGYTRQDASGDALAALIVTILLVPQGLAYAQLAGMPPVTGLYASMLPLILYGLFASSRALAVGPAALTSLITLSAAGSLARGDSATFMAAAMVLAILSGALLVLMAVLRMGWLTNLLSHPVIVGFISGCGLLIATSQLPHMLGINVAAHDFIGLWQGLLTEWPRWQSTTVVMAGLALACLLLPRWLGTQLQKRTRWRETGKLLGKLGPLVAVALTTLISAAAQLNHHGLAVVGTLPAGLPALTLPSLPLQHWLDLAGPAALLALIGFVESITLAQALAARKRQRIRPNRELMGLGLANVISGLSGAFAVTGSFSRSTVSQDSGARTPLTGILAAAGIALVALCFTRAFFYLPQATLAAIIVVAVLPLVELGELKHLWRFSRADSLAMAATLLGVLTISVQAGLIIGVTLSLALFLWRTSQPHVAEVGRVPGTQHFRNVQRHEVEVSAHVLAMRVDESVWFGNARQLEDLIYDSAMQRPQVRQVIVQCSAINHLDASAVDSLKSLNDRLAHAGVVLNLSEVKGPVMDLLKRTEIPEQLTGQIFLSHHQAMETLAAESP
ncbi:sulfate transporter [Alcanivorax hongdengensis A-11-3]|uniref:Sulfate transporter n=1 Tax=Alcanivorax hongdengensis A-11-3 TaxID=1177179 RepID=L0WIU5_9GAMM|nr:sulfate permease [Alcanivorax hongdengensis]EKF75765.1 sulfate transporter [Alcanivorax hongdengensis A-11-3]